MTDIRQKFEEWAIEKGPCTNVRKGANGVYHSGLTEDCWSAWKAAWGFRDNNPIGAGALLSGSQDNEPAPRGNLPWLCLDNGEFVPAAELNAKGST